MSRLPIRVRVTAACALAMAAVLAGSGLFLYLRLSSHLALALDRELQLRSQDLAALVTQPHASLSRESGSRFIERGESYAQLLAPNGRVLDATVPLGRAPILSGVELREARHAPLYLDRPAVPGLNEPSRLLATTVRRDGRPLVLAVGATLQDRAETLASFRDELLIAGPFALFLASSIGYLLAGLSLKQVESMRRRASAISAETPGERLPVPRTGDEIERLAKTLNEMLERLEGALERERDFVADAGHELRTPLALLRTELELALRQAESVAELKEAVRRSSQEADRLCQLAEDLLLIARADRGRLPLRIESLAVHDLFASVLSRVEWRAAAEGKAVTADVVSAAPSAVTGFDWSRRLRTWSATPFATAAPRSGSGRRGTTAKSICTSETMGQASPTTFSSAPSSASRAPMCPEDTAVPGSGSRLSARLPKPMGAARTRSTRARSGPMCGSRFRATKRDRGFLMPTWGAVTWGVAASGALTAAAVAFLLRNRRAVVIATAAVAAMLGPLFWDLILRHTGGNFFVDAPGTVFPVSYENTGSGVFATAIGTLLLGFGPLRTANGRRLALTALVCGAAALLVDIYLY